MRIWKEERALELRSLASDGGDLQAARDEALAAEAFEFANAKTTNPLAKERDVQVDVDLFGKSSTVEKDIVNDKSRPLADLDESTGSVRTDTGSRSRWAGYVADTYFHPDIPREAQIFRRENLAVVLCYVLVGILQGVSSGVMNVYPLELGATEAQQTTIKVLRSLPATFKIVFGFISDAFPLLGFRRKSYMAVGWGVCSFAMAILACTPKPSIPLLSLLYLLFGVGFWWADVMADALVAEKVDSF